MKKWKKKLTKRLPRSALYYAGLALLVAMTVYYVAQAAVTIKVFRALGRQEQQVVPSKFPPHVRQI